MSSEDGDEAERIRERVDDILSDAAAHVTEFDAGGDQDDSVRADITEVAGRADSLLNEVSIPDLVSAIEASADSEGDTPESIPEALRQSSKETVGTLRQLLALSKMTDAEDDDELAEHVSRFRDASGLQQTAPSDTDQSTATDTEPAVSDTEAEKTASESSEEADETASESDEETDETASESSDDTDYAEEIKANLQEGIDEFRGGIDRVRSELQSKSDEATAEEDSDGSAADDGSGETDVGPSHRRRGMYSTMPSRDRPDMRSTIRFSTVRNNRNNDD